MTILDQRLNAFRPDLADEALRGRVDAGNYVKGAKSHINIPVASLLKAPSVSAMQLTQGLFGEACSVFEIRGGWAWVQLHKDGYVGYVREDSIALRIYAATHRITNVVTWKFALPDLKSQPATQLYLNSLVSVEGYEHNYSWLHTMGAVFNGHLALINEFESDFVAVAERFLNVPYYWGGKTHAGIDCSGLVQTSLHACGKESLRDSDMQEKTLGLPVADHANLRRGDLVFWPGHVGIMQSPTQLIHANGHFMKVTSDLLADVIARSDKAISNIRRLSI